MLKAIRNVVRVALLAPLAAGAATVDVAGDVGFGHSDNIARTATNERDENIAQAGLQLLVQENTRRLAVELAADVTYQEYLRDTYDSEVLGHLDAAAQLRLVPDRLHWNFEDNFGQTRLDLFAAVTPENRENVNFFSTGPDLFLHLGSATQMRVGGRYSRVDYELSPFNSQRYSGLVGLVRTLSEATAVSLNAQTERVEFEDSPPNVDFRRDAAFASYTIEGGRTQLSLDAGVNRIDRSGEEHDGSMLQLQLTRELSSRSTLRLTAGRELTDAGNSLRPGQGSTGPDLDTQSLARGSDPYTSTYGTLGWDAVGRRTRAGISVAYYDESYDQAIFLDRDRILGQAYVARDFAAGWTARLTLAHERQDFHNVSGDYQDTSAILGVSRQLTRRLYIDLSGERHERSSVFAAESTARIGLGCE